VVSAWTLCAANLNLLNGEIEIQSNAGTGHEIHP